jgi:hypothetical protein
MSATTIASYGGDEQKDVCFSRMLKRGGVAGPIPVLAQRADSEDPRWTRAVGIIPATP